VHYPRCGGDCFENACAEGALERGGLTLPSTFGLHAGDTRRRRQAAALQGASGIFMVSGCPSGVGHERLL
jgi:hypothetical protein